MLNNILFALRIFKKRNRMTVNISIKDEILRRYLRHLARESEGNIFRVTRDNDFGKYITSLVKTTNTKINQELDPAITVTIRLPKSNSLASAQNYHLHIPKEDQRKIEDHLRALFNLDVDRYYLEGLRIGDWEQKEIIESFIIDRQMSDLMSDNERIKKRIYRQSLQDLKSLTSKILRGARYRNQEIEVNIERNLVN